MWAGEKITKNAIYGEQLSALTPLSLTPVNNDEFVKGHE